MKNTTYDESVRGHVFDIQRMSINDGPGIRTTVFLKGCPLDCVWCHNPEGLDSRPQLAFTPALCIGCGFCFDRCPNEGHVMVDGEHRILRELCDECFGCTEQCYAKALEAVGKEHSAGEVLDAVGKDKPFYDESGGGMTLSGGEPMAQFHFTKHLLLGARDLGLHTCLETSGFAQQDCYAELLPLVDLFLFDYKESDPERHLKHTGQAPDRILANLRFLDDQGASIILRCPIIPPYNLRDDHLRGIVATAQSLRHCEGIHVMGSHALGESKRQRMGMEGNLGIRSRAGYGALNMSPISVGTEERGADVPTMTREEVASVVARIEELGGKNVVVG